jgi:dTDP-4-amino-4,6-dideoxygalactose transaminase
MEGVNSRLDGLQAAILQAKLGHLAAWTDARRRCAYLYNDLLKHPGLILPAELDDVTAVYHLYVIRVESQSRDALQKYLLSQGVSTGIHYPIPLPFLKAYSRLGHTHADFPNAAAIAREIVSLPLYAELGPTQVSYVADHVLRFLREEAR